MIIKVFGRPGCSACKQMHEKMLHCVQKWEMQNQLSVNYIDMETIDGLAESAFDDVSEIPTVILERDGEVLERYDGGVDDSRVLQARIEGLGSVGN